MNEIGSVNRIPLKSAVLVTALLFLFSFCPDVKAIGLEEGDKAKPFSGADIFGNEVDIAPLIGKQVIVLKFGSIYCSSCVKSITNLAELQNKYTEDKIKVVGINLDIYGVFRVKRFYRGYREVVNYPVVVDENLNISRTYGVATLPSIVIVDKEGKIVRKMVGYQEEELDSIMEFAKRLFDTKDVTELAGLLPSKDRILNVYLPTNFTKTQQSTMYIIGGVTKVGTKVQMTLNGGSRQEIITDRSLFYIRTPISLGSNYIEVSAENKDGGKQTQAIVIFRDPEIGKGFETQFPTYHFHVSENEERCLECHEMAPPESSDQNFMMITQMCLECHTELSQKKYVHGPITVGGCSPCHDFGSQPERYDLISKGSDLCYGCHEEKKKDFSKSFIHGPLAAGVCSVCHSPHASNEPFQQRLPQGQMCVLCHQQIKDMSSMNTQHRPFEDGQCSTCHDPHSSSNPIFFLKSIGNDLCFSCHGEDQLEGHRHPVGTVPTSSFAGMKLTEEGETTCSSCHSPHATEGDFLLPPGGCSLCHSY